jgi:thiol-disulfide isomerase/thioredoxin
LHHQAQVLRAVAAAVFALAFVLGFGAPAARGVAQAKEGDTAAAGPGRNRTDGKTSSAAGAARTEKVASDVTILDGAGIGAKMREAKGHGLFVHLWASWCAPCLEELPLVERFARTARARGATFLSVSLDDVRHGAHVMDVLRRRAPSLTPFVARFDDPDRFMAVFSHEWEGAIPALFGYGADGRLAASVLGALEPPDLERLLAEVAAPVMAPRPPAAPP